MAGDTGTRALTAARWKRPAPLIGAVRPCGKTEHRDLRRSIEAIV
jgi:hypothetical protein